MRLALTTGEPAGVGPELCLAVAMESQPAALIAIGDAALLAARAQHVGLATEVTTVFPDALPSHHTPGMLPVIHTPLAVHDCLGDPRPENAGGLLAGLDSAVDGCVSGIFDAIVTAPLQKSSIATAGFDFLGHTEYIATRCGAEQPVMMIANDDLRVALVTTHLPLRAVPDAITTSRVLSVARTLLGDLRSRFGITAPSVAVCGLNPHAGEQGHLGHEDAACIAPAIQQLQDEGFDIHGPYPADTVFNHAGANADAVLAMYHDQGLPVVKHAGFGSLVNITLGMPIVRTSVDHGSALDLAGTGQADRGSLQAAINLAARLAQ
ncbi:MAG: 4-hydroxythreonine-4-phosphate dehydrogenase PdxA [Pseudomonadota bacterium]